MTYFWAVFIKIILKLFL